MFDRRQSLAQRLAGSIDLLIDVATLGEYGLEPLPAEVPCPARPTHVSAWEALPVGRDRRGGCGPSSRRSAGLSSA